MGVVVNEQKTLPSGVSVENVYISIREVCCRKANNSNSNVYYSTVGCFDEWYSKTDKQEPLKSFHVTVKTDDLPDNLYTTVYDELKSELENYIDDI
jgi:hypothetical protein